MAKAIDLSGSVDQTKFHTCNAANIINMSFINFGSTLYYEEVYGMLLSGLTVWYPTSCPWSPNSG